MDLNISFLFHAFAAAIHGIPVALEITILSLAVAAIPSYFMALARLYKIRILSQITKLFVSYIRGTPLVVQVLIVYSLLPSVINKLAILLGLKFNVFEMNPIVYAVIVFSLHTTAALSEIIRAAIMTVDNSQMDAATSLGMKKLQAFRLIIVPQAIPEMLPNLGNLTVNLFKETSLAFLMTVKDITAIAKIEASYGYNYIEAYVAIFAIYIIMCSIIQLVFYLLEKSSKVIRNSL